MSRSRWLGAPLVLAVLVGCTAEPREPDPPASAEVRVTAAALVAIAEQHLGVGASAVDVDPVRDPSCPASYRRLFASATFDGSRIGITLTVGRCGVDRFTCTPRLQPGREPLGRCTSQELPDGRRVVAGRHGVHQESRSWVAQVTGGGSAVQVVSDVDGAWQVEALADLAADPAYAPLVDQTYVERGRGLVG